MIRVPVSHINGLSREFVERHLEAREQGSFESLSDFVRRCRPGEAEAQLLLDSGALDCFNESRPAMFWQLRKLLRKARRAAIGEALLWEEAPPAEGALTTKEGSASGEAPAEEDMPPIELTRPDTRRIAQRELELLGFPVTIDPLTFLSRDEKGNEIDWDRYTPINELHEHVGRRVTVCGLMVADRINRTRAIAPAEKPEQNKEQGRYEIIESNTARSRAGDLMKFVTLADYTGFVETYLFPDVYSRFGHLTAAHPILAAACLVEPFENRNGFTLRVLHVAPPERKKGDA
jgi:DNA polymerase III alpha subunit